MALALFDSNILIDVLNGIDAARDELAHYDDAAISAITWMEVVAGAPPSDIPAVRKFLTDLPLQIIHTDEAIMVEAAVLRGHSLRKPPKLPLPDAIILATARITGRLLITRNRKDFRGFNVRIPYDLEVSTVVKAINISAPPSHTS